MNFRERGFFICKDPGKRSKDFTCYTLATKICYTLVKIMYCIEYSSLLKGKNKHSTF